MHLQDSIIRRKQLAPLQKHGTNAQSKIEYRIEGTDLAHVQLGTSNAQTLSVSFYVKSNKTGNTVVYRINK